MFKINRVTGHAPRPEDGVTRVTRAPGVMVMGGDKIEHEEVAELALKLDKELKKREGRFENTNELFDFLLENH